MMSAMTINEKETIMQLMAGRNAAMAATATSPPDAHLPKGIVMEYEVSGLVQQVNSKPLLSMHNQYTCLQVDTLMEPAVCNIESAKDILTIFYPLNQN
jgi:hypothetical protein